jgi:PAS domain S-box-containing protein
MSATPDSTLANPEQLIADLQHQLAEREAELAEARERQTATAEVLQVINSSPGDLGPVFDAMLDKALRLCDASFGFLLIHLGDDRHRIAATRGLSLARVSAWGQGPLELGPRTASYRLVRGERFVHVRDARKAEGYLSKSPIWQALVDIDGARTFLAVSLRKDGVLLGAFTIYRREVRPFTEKEIALVENFAAHAVIAMENARLITETREALERQAQQTRQLDASRAQMQAVYDNSPDWLTLFRATKDGGFVYEDLNRATEDAYGLRRDQVIGRRLEEILGTDQAQLPLYHMRACVQTGENQRYTARRTMAGLTRTIDVMFVRVPEKQDDDYFIMATARDITEREAMEQQLRHRQAELRVTFDNMGDGVAMFDADLLLTAWNRNFQQILDLTDEYVATHPSYAEYLRYHAKRGEFGNVDIEAEVPRRLQAIDHDLRFEHIRPDGRIIEVRRNPVPGGGAVLIYSDVTERKRAEAEIRAARDSAETALLELQAAQDSLIHAEKMASLGQLTAGIAHEIKNPLNFVNNFAGLSVELLGELKETAVPAIAALGDKKRAEIDDVIEMLTGNLQKIAEHGRRADGIVKSMLEHSRGRSGERRGVDLNRLVDEALNLAYHGARAQNQSFNITLERDFEDGSAPIDLVPPDITRVCLNLFSNGFYAAAKREKQEGDPKFEPTLRVTTRDLGGAVEIRIRDNGIGISPEVRDKLFQPFFTTKPTGEGTGLGLSISYDIVAQQHGGTIEVASEEGFYTEFTIRLPRH